MSYWNSTTSEQLGLKSYKFISCFKESITVKHNQNIIKVTSVPYLESVMGFKFGFKLGYKFGSKLNLNWKVSLKCFLKKCLGSP